MIAASSRLTASGIHPTRYYLRPERISTRYSTTQATTEIYLHAEERDKDQSELQIYNELFGVSRELSQREKLQEILAKRSDDQIEELAPIVTRFYEDL